MSEVGVVFPFLTYFHSDMCYTYLLCWFFPATRYCSLVESEGGLLILEEIIHNDKPYARIKQLATMVIYHCQLYKEKKTLDTDAPFDG
jgi:hypothetical protein